MEWVESISEALEYIEKNLDEELTPEIIAKQVRISPFYFQKGFSMLCGFTVGEYIRRRRLAQAAGELAATEEKVIDIALKYGYDSPDSFTKAFTRFHGVTPASVRRDGALIKSFAPLRISFELKGGYIMEYKIEEKQAFTIIGISKKFSYEDAFEEVPKLWGVFINSREKLGLCGMYGINIDETMDGKEFEYIISDLWDGKSEVPEGVITKTIPAFTWAVFPCVGPMPVTIQATNKKIFAEWLPNCRDYDFAAGYNIEMYADPSGYPEGTEDENYYCEVWIPVKKKQNRESL
jgi:AraC-type DNA-binding domain-containing proteins